MIIKKLAPHVINSIAAGEVIDRPTSVVKELIENSLDAGATQIIVELEQGGLQQIKVTDNGQGISQQDVPLVFERYATSKLSELDELLKISSYGFRGEALFSIMSVADVTLTTKAESDQTGTEVVTINGQVIQTNPIGHRQGTSIQISQLFQRLPVRRNYINTLKEVRDTKQLIHSFALIFPEVIFQLKHNGKLLFVSLPNSSNLKQMSNLWKTSDQSFLSLEKAGTHLQLTGWLSLPQHFASHRKNQLIAINCRPILAKNIHQAIETGLSQFRHAGKHPQYFLNLQISPHLLDINIHPQKKQVRFLEEENILKFITDTVKNSFIKQATSRVRYSPLPQPTAGVAVKEAAEFKILSEIQQLAETYLFVTTSWGLLLLDQHAADERIWYNRLLEDQTLVGKIEHKLSIECKADLDDDLYQHSFDQEINAKIATIACHQAIRAGQKLSQQRAKQLIVDTIAGGMKTLVCPHGRPTHMFLTEQQLATMFRRK